MLLVTRDGVYLQDEGEPSVLVTDDDYLFLSRNKDACKILLDSLEADSVVVDRLGNEIEKGNKYERKEFKVQVPNFNIKKEMGYYGRL